MSTRAAPLVCRAALVLATVAVAAATALPPHPRVALNDTGLGALRAGILRDPILRGYYGSVLAHGRALLATPPIPFPNCTVVGACRNSDLFGRGANYIDASGARDVVQTCALLHRLGLDNATDGGATIWSARALLELDAIAAFPSWYWPVGQALERAGMAWAAAIGHDWLFTLLSAQQRGALESAMGELVLHTRENDELQSMWWINDVYNWNVNVQAPLLALTATLADSPTWAPLAARVQAYVLDSMPAAIGSFAPDGVWPESPSYQSYALSELVHGAAALQTSTGSDGGLLGGPGVCGAGLVNIFNAGPSMAVFNRGDAGAGAPGTAPLFYLSATCNMPVLAAFARELISHGVTPSSEDVLWYSAAGSEADLLALPLARAFADPSLARSRGAKTHFVSFREAWLEPSASWVALKGGENWFDDGGSVSHNDHGHHDIGSFVLESDGVRWAVDLGGGSYDFPLLSYFGRFRFGYALTSSTTHNVLSFDDVTQNRRGQGRIIATSTSVAVAGTGARGDAAAVAAAAAGVPAWAQLDLTSAYGGATFVLRNVSLSGRVVTIEDSWLNSRATIAHFQFATTAAVAVNGSTASLTESGASLLVSATSAKGAAIAWRAPLLELAVPQVASYGGKPVFLVIFSVPAGEGGIAVVFTPH